MKSRAVTRTSRYWVYSGLLLILVQILACSLHNAHHPIPAIYYWKTQFKPEAYELGRWQEASIKIVYLHCFDIIRDPESSQLIPGVIIRDAPPTDQGLRFIPVIFITQDAIRQLPDKEIEPLAEKISGLVQQLFPNAADPNEVQIDCDWTTLSRDTYFHLLKALHRQAFFQHKQLSCTIRFHQIKFRLSAGIPPVDRAVLMCYNMGDLREVGAHNSILDLPLAQNYLQHLDHYPLKLDIALPLFSWTLQFRDNHFMGILRDVQPEGIDSTNANFISQGQHQYRCLKDTFLKGNSIKSGDVLRTESPSEKDLLSISAFCSQRMDNDSLRVIFFHSDSLTLYKHPKHEIQAILDAFQ